jgi:hypothetical protein
MYFIGDDESGFSAVLRDVGFMHRHQHSRDRVLRGKYGWVSAVRRDYPAKLGRHVGGGVL